MTGFILKIRGLKVDGVPSDFSKFFREASSREKKRVFMDVARRASEDQRKVLEEV